MTRRSLFNIVLMIISFIFICGGTAHACVAPVWLFNPAEWGGIFAFFGLLIAVSAEKDTMLRDLIWFYVIISAICITSYYFGIIRFYIFSISGISGILFLFTGVFTLRAVTRGAEDKKYFALLILVPALAYLTFNSPPPVLMLGHGVCQSRLKNFGTALDMYKIDHKGMYPEKLDKLAPDYFKEVPECIPALWNCSYKDPRIKAYKIRHNIGPMPYKYEVSEKWDRYTINCMSENHKPFQRKWMYSSVDGLSSL